MASRLETLRTTILAAIEAKRFVSGFVENDFQVSTRWYPVTDYPGLATASGLVLVLGRPSDTEPLIRYGLDAFEEIFRFQIVVLYAATSASETGNARINQHIELVEQIQDLLRTTIPANPGVTWTGSFATKDPNGTPYHFMEMDRGCFCSMFEMEFHVSHSGAVNS